MLRHMMPVQVVVLTDAVAQWERRAQSSLHHFESGCTNATSTNATADELMFIQKAAHASQSRITLCAWEPRRKFVHVHAPFKTSPFPDRDVHYMERYFKYFRQVPR